MNEEVINDLYSNAVSKGYKKSREEFVSLLNSNDAVLNDMYSYVQSKGYKKGVDDFKLLVGATSPMAERPVASDPVEPVKKKDTVLPFVDGGLEPTKSEPTPNKLNDNRDFSSLAVQVDEKLLTKTPRESRPVVSQDVTTVARLPKTQTLEVEENKKYIKETERLKNEAQNLEKLKEAEQQDLFKQQNILALQDPELGSLITQINKDLIDKEEREVTDFLNKKFSKFGFHFESTGVGDAVIARTIDGKKSIEIDLDPFLESTEIEESEKLRKFISSNSQPAYNYKDEDYITKAVRAQSLRELGMKNDDGTESTVKFTSFEQDGKHFVIPTLFPKNPFDYSSEKKDWLDLPFDQALNEARLRGEVFEFDNEADAQKFAEGDWKNVNAFDIEGQRLYKSKGLDYYTEKKKFENYTALQDEVELLEKVLDRDVITPEEKLKYPQYFAKDGRPLYSEKELEGRLDKTIAKKDQLLEQVFDVEFLGINDGPIQKTREEFDLVLDKKQKEIQAQAIKQNNEANSELEQVNLTSMNLYGVPIEKLYTVAPKTSQDVKTINDLVIRTKELIAVGKDAANKFEVAKTYYDAKWNKAATEEYEENLSGFNTALKDAWQNGKAAEQILLTTLGIKDVDINSDRKDIAAKIAEASSNLSGKQSRVLTRLNLSRDGEFLKTLMSDPLEAISTFTASSFTQILPYGSYIIPTFVASGMATGAAIGGSTGGAPGAVAGAVTGLGYGVRAGMSASFFALEYTNSILDVMKEKGYDITDPLQVEKGLMDESVWSEGGERGVKRGIPIAIVDYLSAGLAGKIFKVSKIAPTATRVGALAAERVLIDPTFEMAGEFAAQKTAGQEVNLKEIAYEGLGGIGSNTSMMGLNMYLDSRNQTSALLALELTDINTLASQRVSDERISNWANNMQQLGKIDADVNQRIQQNVGLRREARDLLSVGSVSRLTGNTSKSEARVMELLAARQELTSTQNRREVNSDKIKAINQELAELSENKKVKPKEEQVNLDLILGTKREGVSRYQIGGKVLSKEQFNKEIANMSAKNLLRSKIKVDNDEETQIEILNKQLDAIQKQTAGEVPVQPGTRDRQEMAQGEPQAEPQGITKENIKEKITEVNNKSAELQRRQQLELDELNKKENKNYRDAFDILNVNEYSEDQTPRSQEAIDLANRHTQEFNDSLQEKRNIESEAEKLNFSDYNLTDNNKLDALRESINSVYQNNRGALDEGFEASVTALEEANSVGGNNYLAHGMGKTNLANAYNDLINLFKKGINPIRGRGSLDVAPLSGGVSTGTTASGNAYMDGPFTLVANRNHSGPITNINQVGGIIVNEGLATPEVLTSLRDLFPNLAIESTSNTKSLIEQLNSKTQEEVAPVSPAVSPTVSTTQEVDVEGEVSRLEQLFAEQETAPTVSAGISISNDADVEELRNRTKSKSQQATTQEEKESVDTRVKIIDTAKKAIKTLKSVFPDIDIVIHDDEGSYNAAMADMDGASGTRGNFSYEITPDGKTTGRIDINLSRANSRTVAHEVAHGILFKTFGENSNLFNDFRTRLSKVLKTDVNNKLNEFADKYFDPATGQLLDVNHEEFLVELTGMLEQQETNISVSTMQKVAALINEFVSKITGGKFKPFEDTKNTKDVVDFFNTISGAIREGSEIQQLNSQEPYSSGVAIPVSNPQEFVGKKFKSQVDIGDYKFPSGIDILTIADLPIKTLTELVRQYEGRVLIITSDATGYGVDRNGDPILGGFGFASNKKNVDDGIGFASVSTGTVRGTYTAAEKAYGTGKTLVLVMIQPPHTTINNSYGAKYIIRGLKEIAASSKEELAKTKDAIKSFIKGSKAIQNELKNDQAALKRGSEKRLFDLIDSIDENTNLEEAVKEFLNDTTFTIRKELGKGIILENKNIRTNKSTNYSKIALNNVGYNIYDFLKEYGDNTFLTDDLILNNTGGYVVGGFELDVLPKEQREALINDIQGSGIVHPLFNAKLPGTNHFRLDGLYDVQENFSEYAKPDTEISLSKEERDALVREIYKDDKFYKAEARSIPLDKRSYTNLTVPAKTEFKDKYLKQRGLLTEATPNVPTKVAKGEGFIPREGAAEQIAKGKFVSRAQAEATPKSKRVSKSQIIGENAQLEAVVRHDLGVAKILSREGLLPQRTKLITGWELGSDGKWRYEIPDGKFKENIDISSPSKLSDIFDAPELYKAYPEARNIEVEFKLLPEKELGNFSPDTGAIIINRSKYKNDRAAAELTMLHEIQHWIQVKEIFQGGSSVVQAEFKMKKIVDYFEKLVKKRESIYDSARLFYSDNQEVVKEAKELLDFAKSQYDIVKELTFEKGTKEEKAKATEMIKNLSEYAKRGIPSAQNLIDELSKKNPAEAFNLYYRVAGEVEARNVEYRNKLTKSQKRNILLSDTENIDRDDQIMIDSFDFIFQADEMKNEFRVSKSQLDDQDRINKLINDARAQGFSEEAIILFLQRKGLTDKAIDTAMAKAEPAAKKVEVTEEFAPGYDRVLNNMFGKDGVVARSRRRGVSEEGTIENAIKYLRGTKVYENATDVQREAMERNVNKEFKKREKRAPSAEKVVGKPKKKEVTVDEMAALKAQIKLEARAAREAKADLNTKRKMIADAINKMATEGKITTKKAEAIVKRASRLNVDSEVSVNKFIDYVSKVFADAEYASKLSTGNVLRKKIKSISKNKDKAANLRDLGVKFSEIDPSMVEDIDQYNTIANKIFESINGSTLKGGVKFSDIVKISDVSDYINGAIEKQNKEILNNKIAEMSELLGIEITEDEYFMLMESINNNEDLPKKYKDGAIRKAINKAFDVYSAMINQMMDTGVDPITGEDISIDASKKKVVSQFMDMDLNILSDKEALAAIDSLLNFIQNGSTAKMDAVYSRNLGEQKAIKLDKKNFKSSKIKKYFSEDLGQFLVEQFTPLDIVMERMFKGVQKAGDFMFESGISALKKGKSLAQSLNNKIVDKYYNTFYKTKPNNQDFNTLFNTVERGMTAYMMRTTAGTESDINADFKRRKSLIKQSIESLNKGNDKNKKLAEVYSEVYDKILDSSNNYDEVVSKADSKNVDAVRFWQSEWANKYSDLSDLSESIYNKTLGNDLNYTPDKVSSIGKDQKIDEDSDEINRAAMSFHSNNQTTYQRETGVLMKPTLDDKLPSESFIDLSFDSNNANSMYDALVDLNTANAVRQISGFFNSDAFKNIVPNIDDRKILKGRVNLFIRNIRNKNPYDNDEFAKAIRGLQNLAALGAGRALAGPTQALKQTIPVMANTIVNAGSIDLTAPFDKSKNDFINNSGYAIANRNAASINQIETLNKLSNKVSVSLPSKIVDPLLQLNELQLKLFLQKPDAYVARAAWITYYENSLKKQGIDTKSIDYATHELNDKAADYAQRMVDRQQNISDMDLAGKFVGSKNPIAQFVNKTIMPFSSFRINQSARMGSDWATLTSKTSTKEDKVIAARSLGGFFVELASFRAVSATLAVVLASLAALISGKEDDEEDREKLFDTTIKGATTSSIIDIVSFLPYMDGIFQSGIAKGLDVAQDMLDVEDADKFPFYDPREKSVLEGLGMLGIAGQRAIEFIDLIDVAYTRDYKDDFGRTKYISEEDSDILKNFVMLNILSSVGIASPEIKTMTRRTLANVKRRSTTNESGIKEKKGSSGSGRSSRGGGMNKTDMKKYNPELYDKMYGPGSAAYEVEQEVKAFEKEQREFKKKMKEELYGGD